MNRWPATADVLDLVFSIRTTQARRRALEEHAATGDSWFLALAAFAAFFAADFEEAATLADAGVAGARDEVGRTYALAARALASAGWWPGARTGWTDAASGATVTGDPLAEAAAALPRFANDASPEADLARYLVAEAGLACGRLELAGRVVGLAGDPAVWLRADGSRHPQSEVALVMRVRLAAFRGRIADAETLVRDAESRPHAPLVHLLVASTASLVRGNAADRTAARALADLVESSEVPAVDYLSRGCRLLAAFGLIAVGDVRRAARMLLLAGGDAQLGALTLVDRGLGLEMLVALAAASGDVDAAEAWAQQAAELRDHPITGSTVARLDSRLALLVGDTPAAVALAELAIARARAEGRIVEAAEGEIVASRARVAASEAGVAAARLEAAVAEAERTGFRAVRVSASRELRSVGRRLKPLAGSGWEGLSAREREVALLLARGESNAGIARELHLSDHTVRAHVSRVLVAFGAASRIVVAAALADRDPLTGTAIALTPRQRAVADQVARGLGNSAIAAALGISVKTVEKHLTDIRLRWGVSTRGELARLARLSAE